MSGTEGEPYKKSGASTKTSGGAEKTGGWLDSIGDTIGKMHIKKLFFVLLIVGYCVVAFSKGKVGISKVDLSNYVIFIIFSLFVYICLHFFEEKYGDKGKH